MSAPPTNTNGYSHHLHHLPPPGDLEDTASLHNSQQPLDDITLLGNGQQLFDNPPPAIPARCTQDGLGSALTLGDWTALAALYDLTDAISPCSTFPDLTFWPTLEPDGQAQWPSVDPTPCIPAALQQSYPHNPNVIADITGVPSVIIRQDVPNQPFFSGPPHKLSYAAAVAAPPPQQQHLLSITPRGQVQPSASAVGGPASNTRTPATLPPSVSADHDFGPPKRTRSYAEALAQPSPTTSHHQVYDPRPKLVLQTDIGQTKRCCDTCGLESCQCQIIKRSKVEHARASPSRTQGPTSAPMAWLNGMRDNPNFQLGQAALGPRVSDWNQAPRLPGDRHSTVPSPRFLQLPYSPAAATASPTASSIASSTRTSSKRTKEEMSIGEFPCWCNKAFSTSNALSHHQRYHTTGPRPHVCLVCAKDFLHDKDLQRHAGVHDKSPQNRFYCDILACHGHPGYARKDHLQRHMRAKHGSGAADSVMQADSTSSRSEGWGSEPRLW